MADVDDYGEWKTGKRITGISFSGNLFFLKVGLAIAGAMVGFLLSGTVTMLARNSKAHPRLTVSYCYSALSPASAISLPREWCVC